MNNQNESNKSQKYCNSTDKNNNDDESDTRVRGRDHVEGEVVGHLPIPIQLQKITGLDLRSAQKLKFMMAHGL